MTGFVDLHNGPQPYLHLLSGSLAAQGCTFLTSNQNTAVYLFILFVYGCFIICSDIFLNKCVNSLSGISSSFCNFVSMSTAGVTNFICWKARTFLDRQI